MSAPEQHQPVRRMSDDEARMFIASPAAASWIETSHDPRDWREAFETTEPGPELNRIRARVAAAMNRGTQDAITAVVLDEASQAACVWRVRALEAEERAEELSRVNLALTEREVAATREAKRLRLLIDGEGA